MVAKIKKLKEFDKLTFLISTFSAASVIPKAIIFFNNLIKKVMLIIYLQKLFFTHIKNDEKRLIRILTSILKPITKAK